MRNVSLLLSILLLVLNVISDAQASDVGMQARLDSLQLAGLNYGLDAGDSAFKASAKKSMSIPTYHATLRSNIAYPQQGDYLQIAVVLDTVPNETFFFGITIEFDTTAFKFGKMTNGDIFPGFLALAGLDGPGVVSAGTGFVRGQSLPENHGNIVCYLYFHVKENPVFSNAQISLVSAYVSDNTGDTFADYVAEPVSFESAVTGVEKNRLPKGYTLEQNYPNPFNPTTTISYSLPSAADVMLTIYNTRGQKIRTLVDSHQSTGRYEIKWNATGIASGVYIYQIKAGEFFNTRRMVLMK